MRALSRAALALSLVVLVVPGCGYRPVYGSAASARIHVKVVRALIADAVAADAVAAGMRDELARDGLLASGDGYPRAEIEVLQAVDSSEGIAASGGVPAARATRVAVVARAWVVTAPGADPADDTGDVRGDQVIAIDPASANGAGIDPRATVFHDADAVRAAARRVGRTLARKVAGEPAAGDEAPDPR
jgi:hypothetical protein